MSIVGVRGIPPKVKLPQLIRKLAHILNGQFDAFNATHKTTSKTCYLRLCSNLDRFYVIEIINNSRFPYQLEAFLPENESQIEIPQKTMKIAHTLRKALKIPLNFTSSQLLCVSQEQLMIEMLSKFTRLQELSKTTNHKLIETLLQILSHRLEEILQQEPTSCCFFLTKCYRDNYPHRQDFELIKDVLTDIQFRDGIPKTDLVEEEFCEFIPESYDVGDVPCNTMIKIGQKYSDKIVSKIMDHIIHFNNVGKNKERETATAKVRRHITNLAPLIPNIVKTLISDKLVMKTHNKNFEVARIYGEPFLPNKKIMGPFLQKFHFLNVQRSERIFNLLTVKLSMNNFLKLLKCNGSVISGSKLVIRPVYSKAHLAIINEIKAKMAKKHNFN